MIKKTKTSISDEVIGWAGVTAYVVGYGLLAFGYINSSNLALHIMYFVGASGLIYHSLKKHDLQPAIVNVFFASIAFVAMAKILALI